MTDADWTLDDVAAQPGYKSTNVAAYECDHCGTIVPVTFVDAVDHPPNTLPANICGTVWDGCGDAHSQTLVSPGFIDD